MAVWGSWFNKYLGWGYSCCYSTQKHSYCLGIKGREKALAKEYKLKAEEVVRMQKMKVLEQQAEEE